MFDYFSFSNSIVPTAQLTVRAGSIDMSTGGAIYGISLITRHPQYSAMSYDYDFGILKVIF